MAAAFTVDHQRLKTNHRSPVLGRNAVIKNGSFGDCEKVTSYLDGYLARGLTMSTGRTSV